LKNINSFIDFRRKYFFYHPLDNLILLSAIAVSVFIYFEKIYFIHNVYGSSTRNIDFIKLLLVNISVYVAVCTWVYLLLRDRGDNLFKEYVLRIYVVFIGFYLCSLVRIIQTGEISTRQGVDYSLLNHLVLIVLGHQEWKVFIFEWFIKLHVFLLFVLGYGIKYGWLKSAIAKQQILFILLFFSSLLFSFWNLNINTIPKSLIQNSLVYVIETSWRPIEGIKISAERSKNIFLQNEMELKQPLYAQDLSIQGVSGNKNIVIFTLESTGANMLDIYSPNDSIKGSTPFLSDFAKSSLQFNDTSAVMTSTTKSLVSILCGIEPYIGFEVFEATVGIPVPCLPQRLNDLGYETIYFQSANKLYESRALLASNMGFKNFVSIDEIPKEERKGAQSIGVFGLEDKVLLNENKRWLEQQKTPFMAFYLTLAQHHPYLKPDRKGSSNKNPSQRFKENFVGSLTYIDSFLEEIVQQYKDTGLYEDTIFIVLGDHGEAFGINHPQRFHNNNFYREGIWVPFFIVNAQLFPNRVENNEVLSLMDVAPTIEHILGIEVSGSYRGSSALTTQENRKYFGSCWYSNRCLVVMDEHYKYIYNYGDSPEELYDRKADSKEKNNLAKQFPKLVEQYRTESFSWYQDIMFSYDVYFKSVNVNYLKEADYYYHVPFEFFTNKLQVQKW